MTFWLESLKINAFLELKLIQWLHKVSHPMPLIPRNALFHAQHAYVIYFLVPIATLSYVPLILLAVVVTTLVLVLRHSIATTQNLIHDKTNRSELNSQ